MDEISEKRERNMFSAPSERFMKQKIVKELKLVQRLVVIKLPTFITLWTISALFLSKSYGKGYTFITKCLKQFFCMNRFSENALFNMRKHTSTLKQLWQRYTRKSWPWFAAMLGWFWYLSTENITTVLFSVWWSGSSRILFYPQKTKGKKKKNCDDRHIYLC